jgi:hypothetical protein
MAQKERSMTHELLKRLSALREINPRLNSVTDQVSEIVRSVEKTLVEELKIGIDASEWFLNESGGQPGVIRGHYLSFSRVGSAGFRINVLIATDQETSEENGGPAKTKRLNEERILWQSCGRELKLKAFEKLPTLLDNIIKSAEALLQTADVTAARIKEMLGDHEPVPPPKEESAKRPLFGRSPLLDNILKGAEGLLQTADDTAAKIKEMLGDPQQATEPRQESRRRSRFSRAPRRVYSVQDAVRAHRRYFLDQGIGEAALGSLTSTSDGWVETGPGEFICCDRAGAERCCVVFVDEEGSAEVKFPDGEEDTVSIDDE